jgi:hypothetical protein
MKKLFIFCFSLFISLCIKAQKTTVKKPAVQTSAKEDFCSVMQKLLTHAYSNFKDIKTGKLIRVKDETIRPVDFKGRVLDEGDITKLKLPGANANYTSPLSDHPDMFKAFFGTYSTLEAARKKIDSINLQLAPCLKDYELKFSGYIYDSSPFQYDYQENRTDSLKPGQVLLNIWRRSWGFSEIIYTYHVFLTIFGLGKIDLPKEEVTYIVINPSLQEAYLPNEVKDLYLGMSVEELNKRHPAAVLSTSKNWKENFSSGDIEEITYQTEFDSPVVYEFVIKYRSEQKAISVARQLYEKSKTATKNTKWYIKLKDGLTLNCWIFESKLCIMKMEKVKLQE